VKPPSNVKTPAQYLASLPADRAKTIAAVADAARWVGTGARIVHEGQLDGRTVHVPVFLAHGRMDPVVAFARATASRDTLRALLSARAELSRLREELTRLREDLNRRDGELVRVRSEADRLKGARVYNTSWDLAELFVVRGLVQADPSTITIEEFVSRADPMDFLVLPANVNHPSLRRVAVRGGYGLYQRQPY